MSSAKTQNDFDLYIHKTILNRHTTACVIASSIAFHVEHKPNPPNYFPKVSVKIPSPKL